MCCLLLAVHVWRYTSSDDDGGKIQSLSVTEPVCLNKPADSSYYSEMDYSGKRIVKPSVDADSFSFSSKDENDREMLS